VQQEGQLPVIDRARCTGCGACAAVCTYGALVLYGKPMTPEEVFEAVRRDKMFYDASGGGITVSGGEALLQPGFVAGLFELCHHEGISTAIETSGNAPESALEAILPLADLLLFDLKLLDPARHAELTGSPNDRILANARAAAASGAPLLFRIPLVPGLNDDEANVRATAEFIKSLGRPDLIIELMPYHRLGSGKYASLDRPYPLLDLAAPSKERLREVRESFRKFGVACSISE